MQSSELDGDRVTMGSTKEVVTATTGETRTSARTERVRRE
ncbi:hypothetical protein PF003_g23837 [Phytophthora fragariae]|nr:hypothetical protein PF003_g23837 [Phytophthora fragariae]